MTDVEIECVTLDLDPVAVDLLWEILSPDEQRRAARFRFVKHRTRFIACRGQLRQTLGKRLGVKPFQIAFSYNSFGKPFVNESTLYFNVSHSEGLALIAISPAREVGVDIEHINPAFAQEQIPERFFSPGEVAALRSLPVSIQDRAFFQCWTRKEAYVKARGLGLSLALDSFDVTLAPGEPAAFLRGAGAWSIESLEPAQDFIGAIVGEGSSL